MIKFNIILLILAVALFTGCKNDNQIELSSESYNDETILQTESTQIYVHITGQVKNPGVYQVDEGTRLFQLVELAGGMTKKASSEVVNLAEEVKDGQSIHILSKSEYKKSISNEGGDVSDNKSTLININTSTKDELTSLPGIGESKAVAIISYREDNGNFKSIEDIKNVSGIGDSTFDNIRDLITID